MILTLSLVLLGFGIGLVLSCRRKRISARSTGNILIGTVYGDVEQDYTGTPPASTIPAASVGTKEMIGWLIALPGAALALWTLCKSVLL